MLNFAPLPAHFFAPNPVVDNLGPYYNVVDSLITQVTHLENRINLIESSSELSVSFVSDCSEMQRSPSRLGVKSAQSTPQKPRSKFTVSSLPNSPDDRVKSSPQRSKVADVNPMLGEIDSFISNVKCIKRLNAVRNLEGEFNNTDLHTNKLDINQVNELLKEVELQEKQGEKPCIQHKWQAGDNIGSVPDYGYGVRKNLYSDVPKKSAVDSDSSSESTQMTAFDKFKYKEVYEGKELNLGLLSLSKLWKSQEGGETPRKYQQKLQEERLRRQHKSERRYLKAVAPIPLTKKSTVTALCRLRIKKSTPQIPSCKLPRFRHLRRCRQIFKHCEQAIQELQNRVLELQERVAVAIQVDEAKDKAILRFHDSWEKAGSKLQNIERQKERLEVEVEKLRKQLSEDSVETHQKISHYEKEASLALNIAHSSQDKLATLEKSCRQLESELKIAQTNSEEFQKKFLAEMDKNRQYPEILAQKELELNDCKSVLNEARKEVAQSQKVIELCQSELEAVKRENDTLQSRLNAERDNTKKVTEQKNKLLEEINAHKEVAKGLQEELSKAREQLETNKVDLKNFYQGQVELVVQNKLKEFQKQLDDAEKALKEELSRKEMSIAKSAASHIQQISEKHSLEIKLIEEKHQEQSRLYQLQISQLRHELDDSNHKIKRQHDKHLHIEKQLHRFMESLKQDHMTTIDEMNSFKSKSFTNLEEILSFNMGEEERPDKMRETPVTSRGEKGGKRKEGTLQETIQMLLDRKGNGDDSQLYQKLVKDGKGKQPWK